MKRCERCLREITDACPAHPHADRLDPEHPNDQQWITVLEQQRGLQRWRAVFGVLGISVALLSVWVPQLVVLVPLVVLAAAKKPSWAVLSQPHALLPPDNTVRTPRRHRRTRSSGRRPEPGRVTIAG